MEEKKKFMLFQNRHSSCIIKLNPEVIDYIIGYLKENELQGTEFSDLHICIVHPFISYYYFPKFKEIIMSLGIQGFDCQLKEFRFFRHGESFTIYLHPVAKNNEFERIRKTIKTLFKFDYFVKPRKYQRCEYIPHVTVAGRHHFSTKLDQNLNEKKLEKILEKFNKNWKPISFKVVGLNLTSKLRKMKRETREYIPFEGCEMPHNVITKPLPEKAELLCNVKFPFYPFGFDEGKLFVMFEGFEIEKILVKRDKETKLDKGWAVIKMVSLSEKLRIIDYSNENGFYAYKTKRIFVHSFY